MVLIIIKKNRKDCNKLYPHYLNLIIFKWATWFISNVIFNEHFFSWLTFQVRASILYFNYGFAIDDDDDDENNSTKSPNQWTNIIENLFIANEILFSLSFFSGHLFILFVGIFLYILNAICLRTFEMRNDGYHCFWYNDKSWINQYIQCGGGGVQFQESKIVLGSLCQVLCGDENLRIWISPKSNRFDQTAKTNFILLYIGWFNGACLFLNYVE